MKDKWQKMLTNRRSNNCSTKDWCSVPKWGWGLDLPCRGDSWKPLCCLLLKTLRCACDLHQYRSWTNNGQSKGKTEWFGGRSGLGAVCINIDQRASGQLEETLEQSWKNETNHSCEQNMCTLQKQWHGFLCLRVQNPSNSMCCINWTYWIYGFFLRFSNFGKNIFSH